MDYPFLSIIIPAHNEESRLPLTLQNVNAFLSEQPYTSEVLIVENGSRDKTLELGLEFARKYANMHIIHLEESGKGLAIQKGILETTGSYRFIADADFSMPIEEINKFIPPISECEINIASREAQGSMRFNEPVFRHITGRVYNLFIRLLLLPGLQDTQCGFKCFSSEAAKDIFHYQKQKGWAFDVELLYIARLHGWHIKEIPVHWYYSSGSKINIFRDATKMFLDLLTIRKNAYHGVYHRNSGEKKLPSSSL